MRVQIDFMAHRRLAAAVSIALVVMSVLLVIVRGINFGLDFSGGTLVEVTLPAPVSASEVREELASRGFADASVQHSGSERQLLVRVPPRSDTEAFQLGDRIVAALAEEYPGVRLERARISSARRWVKICGSPAPSPCCSR